MSKFIEETLINRDEKKSRPMNAWLAAELDRVAEGVENGTIKTYTWAQMVREIKKIGNV